MATNYREDPGFREDYYPVRSRISWGAILAGAAVSLAIYILLSLFGLAIGLSVGEGQELGTGTAIWMIIVTLVALYAGGWVTTQCTYGESRSEAAVYGVVLWGVLYAVLLWLAAIGVQIGFTTMLGMTNGGAGGAGGALQQGDVTAAAWWAFIGTLISILAAVGGAIHGAASPRVLKDTGTRRTAPPRT